ncbi:MAG TPA: hypothetical protein VI319_09595 [Burkholderiales bacterium]
MSAAATAAGYLYASGRLRGRGAREQEHGTEDPKRRTQETGPDALSHERAALRKPLRKPVRVAALPPEEPASAGRPKRAPRVQYRVRRWRPEQEAGEGREPHGHE